jgi:hypothetical protein
MTLKARYYVVTFLTAKDIMRKYARNIARRLAEKRNSFGASRLGKLAAGAAIVGITAAANAQSDVGSIVTAATTTWSAVATLCVVIGTFVVGYNLVRKVH